MQEKQCNGTKDGEAKSMKVAKEKKRRVSTQHLKRKRVADDDADDSEMDESVTGRRSRVEAALHRTEKAYKNKVDMSEKLLEKRIRDDEKELAAIEKRFRTRHKSLLAAVRSTSDAAVVATAEEAAPETTSMDDSQMDAQERVAAADAPANAEAQQSVSSKSDDEVVEDDSFKQQVKLWLFEDDSAAKQEASAEPADIENEMRSSTETASLPSEQESSSEQSAGCEVAVQKVKLLYSKLLEWKESRKARKDGDATCTQPCSSDELPEE